MTDAKKNEQQPTIPVEYAGKVVAWDSPERTRIVGHGRGYEEARQEAVAAGIEQPFLERVPRHDRTFIGRFG